MIYLKAETTPTINIEYMNLGDRIEKTNTPTSWSWLMVFTNDFTKEVFTLIQILGVSALYTPGSNMLKLPIIAKITGIASGLKQELALTDLGYYSYGIYLQDSLTNLDKDDEIVGELVNSGKALVYNSTNEVEYKEQKDGTPNNFIYVP